MIVDCYSVWKPLLTDSEAGMGEACLDRICSDLLCWTEQSDAPSTRISESLAGGTAGLALFFATVSRSPKYKTYEEEAITLLNNAISSATTCESLDFYGGAAGIAWAVQQVGVLLGESTDELDEVDTVFQICLSAQHFTMHFDLVSGYVGLGVYCLGRLTRSFGRECLTLIVDHLIGFMGSSSSQMLWRTPPRFLPDYQRQLAPRGHCDLGLAHGIPGIVTFLSLAYEAGVRRDVVPMFVEQSVNWLLEQRFAAGSSSIFPTFVGQEQMPSPSRLAWCYGDLSVAVALYKAGTVFENEKWKVLACEAVTSCALRTRDRSGVVDSGLCHGSAGVAHIFNRFFYATGNPLFGDAARRWFAITLGSFDPGALGGGFPAYTKTSEGLGYRSLPGLLEGVAGIGLSIYSALNSQVPLWDRMLLTDIG